MTDRKRLEAVGSRGEACIIVCVEVKQADGSMERNLSLATGERLKPTDIEGEYETMDGRRRFALR